MRGGLMKELYGASTSITNCKLQMQERIRIMAERNKITCKGKTSSVKDHIKNALRFCSGNNFLCAVRVLPFDYLTLFIVKLEVGESGSDRKLNQQIDGKTAEESISKEVKLPLQVPPKSK